jgi:hypothetical protein
MADCDEGTLPPGQHARHVKGCRAAGGIIVDPDVRQFRRRSCHDLDDWDAEPPAFRTPMTTSG